MGGNAALGPWHALPRIICRQTDVQGFSAHPPGDVLVEYVAGRLPARPETWSHARAQALERGDLTDWTSLEVAAHVSLCPRCGASVAELARQEVREELQSAVWRWGFLRQPRVALVGWVLAGAQAVAILALVVWMSASKAPQPPLPSDDPLLSDLVSSTAFANAVRIRFDPHASAAAVTEELGSLGVLIYGPDAEGYYGVLLTGVRRTTIEELRAHPFIVDIRVEERRRP